MKRGGYIERRARLKADPGKTRRRRGRDRGEYQDLEHLRIVRTMICCALGHDPCSGRIDPHHAGEGLACPDPEKRKTCDRTAIPLCRYHHRAVETMAGPFRGWDRKARRLRYDEWIYETRVFVDARRAA